MQWDGGDDDGYVKGYEWKYTTTYASSGTEVDNDWEFTTETQLEIAFNSADSIGNYQVFQVRAVDDKNAVDPTPATKIFYTRQTVPPSIVIRKPYADGEFLVKQEVSDWFWGVPLLFSGTDEDGIILEYGISVDGEEYFWTEDTSLFLLPR